MTTFLAILDALSAVAIVVIVLATFRLLRAVAKIQQPTFIKLEPSKRPGTIVKLQRDEITACARCGGMRVHTERWVDENRDLPLDTCGDGFWCSRCQEHVNLLYLCRYEGTALWHERYDRERYVYRTLREALRSLRTHARPKTGPDPMEMERGYSRWQVAQPKDAA